MSVSGKRLIRGSSHAFPWVNWISGLIFGGLGTAIYLANSPRPTSGQQTMLMVAVTVTALIALGTFWRATRLTLRHFRYRGLQLELVPGTAVAGGEFAGTLLVPIPHTPGREFKVELSAAELTAVHERDRKGDGYSYRTISRPLHAEARQARAMASGPGTLLRFTFRLPVDAQPSLGYAESVAWTSLTADRVYVKWHIGITADVPGIDLDESFEIPVVRPEISGHAQQQVHVYETTAPWVRRVGKLAMLVLAGWLIWPWASAFYEANWGEESTRVAPVLPVSAIKTERPVAPEIEAPRAAPAVANFWPRFEHAMAENSQRRFTVAERELQRILADVERGSGPDHPLAGMIHYHLAMVYGNERRMADRETKLKRALEIFEGQSVQVVKVALGPIGWALDRESVARELGDLLWERRRPADAYGYYEKAHAAAAELDATEAVRNERLALSAAGIMVTSCTLQKWDVAESAMAEVKERYPMASPDAQRKLKYWIDTGEPRLKTRDCK